ncbi:putative pectinesterase 63 [Papaver somniferum]|uniref:putative pectinesterase 63 n=1 Tax=Papaver somniferum TaxID=3469 RepID=UPI000E705F38|nr:putative pectinesterase 63 [Papaver somniferum]
MKNYIVPATFINTIFLGLLVPVFSFSLAPIPSDPASLNSWAHANLVSVRDCIGDISNLDPALVTAEKHVVIIKVRKDGSGQFRTVTDAIKSIPKANTQRTIVWIGPGVYKEKITIERDQPFVTLYGDANDMPVLTFDGTARQYGTVFSGSVTIYSEYFMAVNIIFENSSPMPKMGTMDGQAVAMTIAGDKAAFYNCRFKGFQDTLCDLYGNHFFKDCYIEGMADFIFGDGKSVYLNSEIRAVWDQGGVITAHGRTSESEKTGFAFIHGSISGVTTGKTYLGRLWRDWGKVVFLYVDMGACIHPEGWSDNGKTAVDKTVYYGEYMNKGPGSNLSGRVKYAKKLTDAEARPFLDLNDLNASAWLLPPPHLV